MGRKKIYTDDTKVRLHPNGKSKLQVMSDRRAIVLMMIEHGGVMTIGKINEGFGFDISSKVVALIRAGWLDEVTK